MGGAMPEIGTERVSGNRATRIPDTSREQGREVEPGQQPGPTRAEHNAGQEDREGSTSPNELGLMIHSEVDRAQSRLDIVRSRAQSVLTASGALVTLLAAVIALGAGNDPSLSFSALTKGSAVVALVAFVMATLLVLAMYLPANVSVPSSGDLARFAQTEWHATTWEQDVAVAYSSYLISLRSANRRLAAYLRLAVSAEVLGIASTAIMALSLLPQLN